jgi:peptidoglycan/LPS O-acetylase OafA/YrhL
LRGLDGLRAIAVIAVLLFHADVSWVQGGYLGVDLFFVISGFLITGLLADQCQRQNTGLLAPFYWRRAKRLLPAAWLMIAGVVAAASLFAADALPRLRSDALASFFYVTNWGLIARDISYFESTGRPPLLMHLWSLAIEEQFYLLWAPLVLWGLPRLGRGRMAIVTVVLALASAAWMAVMSARIGYLADQTDPSRLYFGTDTHGFALLFGAALGLLWQPHRQTKRRGKRISTGRAWQPLAAGLTALAAMLALFGLLYEQTSWLYPWGFLLSAAVSVVLIVAATHPGSAFGLWLDQRVMRWIGERSYGIYLWHWPIFMLTRPDIDLPALPPAVVACGRIALVIAVAALSYTWVESPIRQGLLERLWRNRHMLGPSGFAWRRGAALSAGVLVTFSAAAMLLHTPARSTLAPDVRAAFDANVIDIFGEPDASPIRNTQDTLDTPNASPNTPQPVAYTPQQPAPPPPALPEQPGATRYTGEDLTALGDSVLLGSSRLLKATLKGVDVHATVGWQAFHVLKEVQALNQAGQLRPVVLVHLGTNGYVTETLLRQILSELVSAKRVLLVNNHAPRRWMNANNALFQRVAADDPHVVLVDWHQISSGNRRFFVSDDVHLTLQGQRAFIEAIMNAGDLVPTPTPFDQTPSRERNVVPACAALKDSACALRHDAIRLLPAPVTMEGMSAMKPLSFTPPPLGAPGNF